MNNIERTSSAASVVVIIALAITTSASPAAAAGRGAGKQMEGVVNINSASSSELQLLAGVGPAKADKIVEYRTRHPFRTVAELGRVKGLGAKAVQRLRLYLTVRGPTTAHLRGTAPPPPLPSSLSVPAAAPAAPPPPVSPPPAPRVAGPDAGAGVAEDDSLGAALAR